MKGKFWIVLVLILLVAGVAVYVYCGSGSRQSCSSPVQKAVCEEKGDSTLSVTWLELPGAENLDADYRVTHYAQMDGRQQRNYTVLYDADTYTSYWVAYPLCHAHMTSGREEIWGYDPKVDVSRQTGVGKGYGVSCPTRNYPKNFYARGHQLPNADRNAVPGMQEQTYYSTNITPQIQHGFNSGIWKNLEAAVRDAVPQGDTLYVVTGASLRKVNENLAPKQIVNKNDGKTLPVPSYYWKVLLKVRRAGGKVTDAMTIGFWLPHEDLKGGNHEDYAVSADLIEQWTGFNMFVNLADDIENRAESNDSWAVFKAY